MTTPTTAILGIDLGTTEVKAGLVGLDGHLVAIARAGYGLSVGRGPGWAEQDPGAWWSAVVVAVHALHPPEAVDVVAVGVDGHGPTLVAVDERGAAVRPAITFLDTRAVAEADELAGATGIRGWALGPLPAALWLERHDPDAASRARWYLATWEWLAFRLTGVAAAPLAPGQAPPDPDLVARATGLRAERRPAVTEMGAVVGPLSPAVAATLGIRADVPVAAGTNDAFASYLGAGLLEAGDAFDPGGSAGGFGVYWHTPLDVPGAFVTPAPLAGLYSVGAAMAATGRALDWFRDQVVGGGVTTERLLEEADATPPGAGGVLFLPYLAGERSPIWDPQATGVFAGLTLAHGRGHLARAIVEASALAIRHVATPMLAAGVEVRAMRRCGGPARSQTWNQVKADVTGFPVQVPAVLETAVLGSAILGAVGIGAHPDLRTAIGAMTSVERRLEPRAEHAETYARLFEAYVALHPAVRPVMAPIAGPGR
jgi:xylulokinase